MKLNLIPQPQYAVAGKEMLKMELSGMKAVLYMPQCDTRLTRAAGNLFGSVQAVNGGDVYCLVSEGCVPNTSMSDRVSGRRDGYVLLTGNHKVEIYAKCPAGLFYGMKTLTQLSKAQEGFIPEVEIADWADVALRSDYLDMRTIYPKFENILKYIAQLADYKINTLVIEYEDKLPFRKLKFLRHPEYAFTEEQFKMVQSVAFENFIDIIPLQQTFGHLEYVLKNSRYADLRERPGALGEMCPHRPGSLELAYQLIEEMAALHPDSRYLHLGCDEVWGLGTCPDCKASGLTREQSFIRFVNKLVKKACSLGKKPIIWHDMFGHASQSDIDMLDKRVLVGIWMYNGNDLKYHARQLIKKLRASGIGFIGCASVRNWDGDGEQNYPILQNRLKNIRDWSELAQSEQFDAIINTNWSASFSLGNPYGLYETTRYPLFYAADHNWNTHANTNDYLERFMRLYHGVKECSFEEYGYEATDYFFLVGSYLPQITENREVAELIDVMVRYELPAKRSYPLQPFLFRGELFRGNKNELDCLRSKYNSAYSALRKSRKEMEAIAAKLLPPKMAELFVMSRFYLFVLYEEKLQQLLKEAENDRQGNNQTCN